MRKNDLVPTPRQPMHGNAFTRRRFVGALAAATAAFRSNVAFADSPVRTPWQTEGPFFPDKLPSDTDNDLVTVGDRRGTAAGQVTHLRGSIVDVRGRPMAGALVEIWQVDANGVYLHSADRHAKRDAGFQGYGRFITGPSGEYYFRTIKPVPYPGRTPHIHFKVSAQGRSAFTTQCYVQGEPLNARDGLLNSIRDPAARPSLIVAFEPIRDSGGRELNARFNIVLA
jgi:protocatechuate 3,4-dioxygenase beta subunit